MALAFSRSPALRPAQHRSSRRAAVRVAAGSAPAPSTKKGFGKAPAGPLKDGCPCGSNKFYKDCCKRFHGGEVGSDIRDTLRARFSAVVKKEVDYLMATFHPEFTSGAFMSWRRQ
jgi:hypothetical protein